MLEVFAKLENAQEMAQLRVILFDLPPRMTNNKTECVFADLK